MRKFCLVNLLSILVVGVSWSQDSLKVTTLEEIVISASRTEQPVIAIPRSVTILSAEEISNSIYQSVGDL